MKNKKEKFHIVRRVKTIVVEEEFRSIFNAERRAFEINDNVDHPIGVSEIAEVIKIEDQKVA